MYFSGTLFFDDPIDKIAGVGRFFGETFARSVFFRRVFFFLFRDEPELVEAVALLSDAASSFSSPPDGDSSSPEPKGRKSPSDGGSLPKVFFPPEARREALNIVGKDP